MRACGECGNWVPEASPNCPRCGRDMAAAVATPTPTPISTPSSAPAVDVPSTPPPAPQWAPPPPAPAWGPPGTAAPPPCGGGWQPVAPQPRKKVWPRVLAWVAGVFAVLVVAVVVLALVFGDK